MQERLQVVSPGLTVDLVCTVLRETGYDVTKMNVTDYQGYVTSSQELLMETAVSKRAIGVVTGLLTTSSFVDELVSLDHSYEIQGTTYSFVDGRLTCQDYKFKTNVRRDSNGEIQYGSTIVHIPDLISYINSTDASTTTTVPVGTLTVKLNWAHIYFNY